MVKKKMKFELSKHIVSQVNKYSESKNFKDGVNWRDEEKESTMKQYFTGFIIQKRKKEYET